MDSLSGDNFIRPDEDLRNRIKDYDKLEYILQRSWPNALGWLVRSPDGDRAKDRDGECWGICALLVVIRHVYSELVQIDVHQDVDSQNRTLALAWLDFGGCPGIQHRINQLMTREFNDLTGEPDGPTFRSLVEHAAVQPLWSMRDTRLCSSTVMTRRHDSQDPWEKEKVSPVEQERLRLTLDWDGRQSIEEFINSEFLPTKRGQKDVQVACNFPVVIKLRYTPQAPNAGTAKGFDDVRSFTLRAPGWSIDHANSRTVLKRIVQVYSIFAVVFESDGGPGVETDEVRLYTAAGKLIIPDGFPKAADKLFKPRSKRRVGDGLGPQFLLFVKRYTEVDRSWPEVLPENPDKKFELESLAGIQEDKRLVTSSSRAFVPGLRPVTDTATAEEETHVDDNDPEQQQPAGSSTELFQSILNGLPQTQGRDPRASRGRTTRLHDSYRPSNPTRGTDRDPYSFDYPESSSRGRGPLQPQTEAFEQRSRGRGRGRRRPR
ncbi:hypothetical protein F4779DRAFT_576786 [Xylariaceae sp. FL0662B]|nr:hypothetical protein F4779DRAFT_576786 [Xylariaceae sp. FL0662B]